MLTALVILGVTACVMLGFSTTFIPGPVDENTRLESSITKTADFNGAALDLGSGFAPGGPGQAMSVIIDTSARDFTTGDETYAFVVQESSDNSSWTTISVAVSVTALGVVAIPVFVSQRYVRTNLDVAGTTPSITYEAWLVPHQ